MVTGIENNIWHYPGCNSGRNWSLRIYSLEGQGQEMERWNVRNNGSLHNTVLPIYTEQPMERPALLKAIQRPFDKTITRSNVPHLILEPLRGA